MIIKLKKDYENRNGLPVINKLDTLIFSTTYPSSGCVRACKDVCCSGGATMDIYTFNKLIKHRDAPIFKGIIWEGYNFENDPRSTGGKGCYTRYDNNRCMFNNDDWGCKIHTYCLEQGIDVRELKFFTCCVFPVEVNKIGDVHNILTAGYEMRYPEFDLACKKNGDTSVYQIAKPDILYYYGDELISEIETIKKLYENGGLKE